MSIQISVDYKVTLKVLVILKYVLRLLVHEVWLTCIPLNI